MKIDLRSARAIISSLTNLENIFRTLKYRNFRLFFFGQGLSLVGTWIQQIALSWFVYKMTNSPFLLGVVAFSGMLPSFFVTPFAGVMVDRWDRHRMLVVTQTLEMAQALILAMLVLFGLIQLLHIILLSLLLGVILAFDAPARQAFVVEMVEKKHEIPNAIALNSFLFNGARLIGPSLAGILIVTLGEGLCFLINGISFIAVLWALLAMELPRSPRTRTTSRVFKELKEGIVYVMHSVSIRTILMLLGMLSLVGMPFTVLIPVFAKNILNGGADTYGFLMAASGLGALFGAVYLASRRSIVGLCGIIAIAFGSFGIGLIIFALSSIFWVSCVFMFIMGFATMVQMASSNTVMQTIVEDALRGRVMSFFVMAFLGMSPFGSLVVGWSADRVGAPNTLAVCGIICVIGSLIYANRLPDIRAHIRPIYAKMGITSEVGAGN